MRGFDPRRCRGQTIIIYEAPVNIMTAKLNGAELSVRALKSYNNRSHWKRGIAWKPGGKACRICREKLMAYLESGHGLDDVIKMIEQRHPGVKYPRKTAMDAIRRATGDGYYDNYIVDRNLWKVRAPIIADGADLVALQAAWKERAEVGREIIEMDKKLLSLVDAGGETLEILKHLDRMGGFPRNRLTSKIEKKNHFTLSF